MNDPKRKTGRPKLTEHPKKYNYLGRRIGIRFKTEKQLQDLHRAAELAGKSTNTWAIGILNLAVFKQLEKQEVQAHETNVLTPQRASENEL